MIQTLHLRKEFERSFAGGQFTVPDSCHINSGALLPERFCHVSNNDHGLKRVLFDIDGQSDYELNGNGATLSFVGEVLPIRIGRSHNIKIKNLTIDWVRPIFTQAVLRATGKGWIEICADPVRYPLRSDRGRLVAHDGSGWQTDVLWNILPLDPGSGVVKSKNENWHVSRWHRAENLGGGCFRLEAAFPDVTESGLVQGATVVLMHGNRVSPGIWVEESDGVQIENVTIHHALGMAVIAQLSGDVTLDRVRVIPSCGRLYSSWVDAFHFVDCTGSTVISGCEARGQFDDAVNIHGTFSRVLNRINEHCLRLQTVHPQRFGRNAATPGSGLAIYLRSTMERVLVTRVCEAREVNQEVCEITLEDKVPECPGETLIVSRYNPQHTVRISGCTFGPNRGRGCLLNTEHKTTVEDCRFGVSGTAIECVPDANYWWEGPPARDVSIRGNIFENCGLGPCGDDLIRLGPEFPDGSDPRSGAIRGHLGDQSEGCSIPVLGKIEITDNKIYHNQGRILDARNLADLTFSRNIILAGKRPQVRLGSGVTSANITDPIEVAKNFTIPGDTANCNQTVDSQADFTAV